MPIPFPQSDGPTVRDITHISHLCESIRLLSLSAMLLVFVEKDTEMQDLIENALVGAILEVLEFGKRFPQPPAL